jgi:hypothetical protein
MCRRTCSEFPRSRAGWLSGRPDALRDGALSRSELRWFDTSAYAVPAPFTFGNSARNLLFAPGEIVLDFSLLKETKIRERATVQSVAGRKPAFLKNPEAVAGQ